MTEPIKRKTTPIKKRSLSCYNRKVKKITKWHTWLLWYRQEEPTKKIRINEKGDIKEVEKKPLKDLDYYLGKIKKPN